MEILNRLESEYTSRVSGSEFTYAVRKSGSSRAGTSYLQVYLEDVRGKNLKCQISSSPDGSFKFMPDKK